MGFPWGLDFGNQNCVVAIARKGGIDVIDNEASSRKTPCMVGLGSKERSIGEAAKAKINSNVKNTATEVKRFIGRRYLMFLLPAKSVCLAIVSPRCLGGTTQRDARCARSSCTRDHTCSIQ